MRTKQVRTPKLKYEYELHISREYDSIKKQNYILFEFRTVKVFKNFIYKINVQKNIELNKRLLEFNVEGLSAPVIDFSKSGYANFEYKFYDFTYNDYQIKLLRNGKNPIFYTLKIEINKISIISKPKKSFLELIIKE